MIKLLLKYGADINATNNYGLNAMHISAQGDQPISLYFFMTKGLSLSDKDHRLNTPLHWACYSGSIRAIFYILAWI
jgi:ankyrin repeat protein